MKQERYAKLVKSQVIEKTTQMLKPIVDKGKWNKIGQTGIDKISPDDNNVGMIIQKAILTVMEDLGYDGKGEEGLVGFLKMVAKEHPSRFIAIIGRVLPMQISGVDGGAIKVESIKRVIVDPNENNEVLEIKARDAD